MGFTGQEPDDETGLVNMRGRIYDPKVARFLHVDPVVSRPLFSQAWNAYSYARNNPLRYVDPTGFDPEEPGPPPPEAEVTPSGEPVGEPPEEDVGNPPGILVGTSSGRGPPTLWLLSAMYGGFAPPHPPAVASSEPVPETPQANPGAAAATSSAPASPAQPEGPS